MKLLSEKEPKELAVFLGKWDITGQSFAGSQGPIDIIGEETYEWLPGFFLLVSNWSRTFGEIVRKGTGLIGLENSYHAFSINDFNDKVYTRTYNINPEKHIWTFTGDKERATIEFSDNGSSFIQKWEASNDGINWLPLWHIKGTKISSAAEN